MWSKKRKDKKSTKTGEKGKIMVWIIRKKSNEKEKADEKIGLNRRKETPSGITKSNNRY